MSVLLFWLVMFLLLGVFGRFRLRSLWFRAFVDAGAPVLEAGFRLGGGAAQFRHVPVGGPVVGRLRSDLGSGDGHSVHLFKDASVSRVILLRRRLGCVFFRYWTVFPGMVLLSLSLVAWSLVLSEM